jgi:hypothetical protein
VVGRRIPVYSLRGFRPAIALVLAAALSGCGFFTDAATRLAYDLESAASRLGRTEGSRYTLVHKTPSKSGECVGPYKVQLDKVGALVIWCYDEAGTTVSSHSTSYHGRYVGTPETIIVDKPARSPLDIDLERRGGRAVIVGVR